MVQSFRGAGPATLNERGACVYISLALRCLLVIMRDIWVWFVTFVRAFLKGCMNAWSLLLKENIYGLGSCVCGCGSASYMVFGMPTSMHSKEDMKKTLKVKFPHSYHLFAIEIHPFLSYINITQTRDLTWGIPDNVPSLMHNLNGCNKTTQDNKTLLQSEAPQQNRITHKYYNTLHTFFPSRTIVRSHPRRINKRKSNHRTQNQRFSFALRLHRTKRLHVGVRAWCLPSPGAPRSHARDESDQQPSRKLWRGGEGVGD